MAAFQGLFGPTVDAFASLLKYWWLWSAPASLLLLERVWLSYRQNIYLAGVDWTLLELRMPREIEKSPKAMEQFFSAIHALRNTPTDFIEKYQDGEVTLWFSLEVISLDGLIHFFIRTPSKHKKVIVGNLYANYPMVEIEETPDYMERFPRRLDDLHAGGYDIWATELVLSRDDVYPIRTYAQYENIEDSMALDPIAGMLEVFSRAGAKENVLLQILVRPATPDWKARGEKEVEKLKIKGMKKIVGPLGEYEDRPIRTPGETELMKAIELNIQKSGFETLIRYVYIAHKENMSKEYARRTLMTAFNQYSAQNLNSFVRNYKVTTDVKWTYWPHLFPERRLRARKQRMLKNYHDRALPAETTMGKLLSSEFLHLNTAQRFIILNTEELATLFHPPTHIVLTGPLLKRVESKKMGPPAGLPIFGKE